MYLEKIKKHLESKINISSIKICNDSKLHNYSTNKNMISHLKIIIVSNDFINKNLITRHRIIFKALKEIEKEGIYSITLYTYTLNEWKDKKNKEFSSIKCIKK
ncbi:BolA family protein [Buchnera aphidicola]|uniref:BolA family transcriptional regulator n=1 Tax=Buchnera aphidicola subsp. Rhopalosiphum maidis TaxID=118109 RepID=A0A3G2I687_BUCRM|nr:BolA/IbaG family iron-sulfur metabolism protein [Buchnera aphidicola]AYN24613.1 BolA family transcriptional regulator [Buchnera aphidicola (Rhopalosiphum maidis)]